MRRRMRSLELLVFVSGLATLGAEIAAARLLAPYFGASTVIWANTIAVVLVALAAGAWLGGRLADGRTGERALRALVLGAAVVLALVPFLAHPFLGTTVRSLSTVSVGGFVGSLLGVLALIAVPVLVLGAVAPWSVRLAVGDIGRAGATAGRLYALSTVGALAGTNLVALVLIPGIGTQRTFLVLAVVVALVALPGLGARFAVAPLVLAGLVAAPGGTVKAADRGRVLFETETPYQYARVVQTPDGARRLELNEGHAVHSLWRPGTTLTGDYWDEFLVLPLAVLRAPPGRVAILGAAGGTTARAYGDHLPDTVVDAVDIDPDLFAIGRRWMGLRARPGLRLVAADARPFLRRARRGAYDALFLDAYRQPYVPFHLATRQFFALARSRLAPGGAIVVNVGHPEGSDRLERVLTATMRAAGLRVARDPAQPTNTLLVGGVGAAPSRASLLGAVLPARLRALASATAARLGAGLTGGAVYTDDRAPVEWLIDRSIVAYAARGGR